MKIVAKFNHTHTIQDVKQYIITASRKLTPIDRDFILKTTFPPKQLTNLSQTIAEAGLLNSAIVQTLV